MYNAVFMAGSNCSTNCLFIDDRPFQSLLPNWILNDHCRLECEWLHFSKKMRVDFQCIMVCSCVWAECKCACVSLSMHICVPAVNDQTSLFFPAGLSHCILFFCLSLSESPFSVSLVTLVAVESAYLGFGRTSSPLWYWWIDFIKHWGSTLCRQQSMPWSILFSSSEEASGAFPLLSRWAPGLLGNCPPN